MVSTVEPGAGPMGRCVAAGEASVRELDRLLGLDAPDVPYGVHAVAWKDHALEASVKLGEDAVVVFRLERRTKDSEGIVQTDDLVLYYRGEGVPAGGLRGISPAKERLHDL